MRTASGHGINATLAAAFLLLPLLGTAAGAAGDIDTDPAHRYAWGENVGWINAAPTNAGATVAVHYHEGSNGWLSGHAWGENIGWIVMGSAGGGPYANSTSNNWGVNLAAGGKLTGYAWGENVGWIRFEQTNGNATINLTNGAFSGHAWGENIGWLSFRGTAPDFGVRTRAFYTQPHGTPNWWLNHHNVTEAHDAGDGVAAWRKYLMDTDPNVAGDYLRLTAISNSAAQTAATFEPASTRRFYSLIRRDDLMGGGWSNVVGQTGIHFGAGGRQTLRDTNGAERAFYGVNAKVTQ